MKKPSFEYFKCVSESLKAILFETVLFKGFPWLNFFEKNVIVNGLSSSCTKNQVIPMVSFVNFEDLKLKKKILSVMNEVNQQTKYR